MRLLFVYLMLSLWCRWSCLWWGCKQAYPGYGEDDCEEETIVPEFWWQQSQNYPCCSSCLGGITVEWGKPASIGSLLYVSTTSLPEQHTTFLCLIHGLSYIMSPLHDRSCDYVWRLVAICITFWFILSASTAVISLWHLCDYSGSRWINGCGNRFLSIYGEKTSKRSIWTKARGKYFMILPALLHKVPVAKLMREKRSGRGKCMHVYNKCY